VPQDSVTLEALDALEFRLKTILPDAYRESYETLAPKPMRSAGLKFGPDGRVAWDEIWGSFCDLAMAGGPPHKGALLQPGTAAEVAADPERHAEVVEEICRGVTLASDLPAAASEEAGWIRVSCYSETMAAWLLRAIVMENVAVESQGRDLSLPASPAFRLEKEIKNVVTVVAKTNHYWMDHMARTRKEDIAILFDAMAQASPLLQPAPRPAVESEAYRASAAQMAAAVPAASGLPLDERVYPGWLGVRCPTVGVAVWLMRALVASNMLARREDTTLFLPVHPDVSAESVATRVARVRRFAELRGVL
jgi:hypothetical protein